MIAQTISSRDTCCVMTFSADKIKVKQYLPSGATIAAYSVERPSDAIAIAVRNTVIDVMTNLIKEGALDRPAADLIAIEYDIHHTTVFKLFKRNHAA
jgi:hypothetical protein